MGRSETLNIKKNTFCYYNHKFYINNGKQACHFVGNSKLKPIDYVVVFNIQEESAAITASTDSRTVVKTKRTSSTTYSTSFKKMPHEESGQTASVN